MVPSSPLSLVIVEKTERKEVEEPVRRSAVACCHSVWREETLLTGEGKTQLLCAQLVLVQAAEQWLHLDDEQVGAVLPGLGHRTNVLQQEHSQGPVYLSESVNPRAACPQSSQDRKKPESKVLVA